MTTADNLARMQDDGKNYELVAGELRVMSPAGGRHGRIAVRISISLGVHVEANHLGATFAAETGFRIARAPDTVRAPDASFVSQDKLDTVDDDDAYLPFAPNLAVEVVSPHDSFASVEEKAFSWLKAGSALVLLVVPQSKSVHAYRSKTDISVYGEGELVSADDVVPGWTLNVSKVFA